jgi:hypothetical protein
MDTHKNAPLTPKGRETMVGAVIGGPNQRLRGGSKTVAKWVNVSGPREFDGSHDRSSRPSSLPSQTAPPTAAAVEAFAAAALHRPADRRRGAELVQRKPHQKPAGSLQAFRGPDRPTAADDGAGSCGSLRPLKNRAASLRPRPARLASPALSCAYLAPLSRAAPCFAALGCAGLCQACALAIADDIRNQNRRELPGLRRAQRRRCGDRRNGLWSLGFVPS